MNELRVIAITHKHFSLEEIGQFHLAEDVRASTLSRLKKELGISELMYLSTCNRVELIFTNPFYVCPGFTSKILAALNSYLDASRIMEIAEKAERYHQDEAAEHLLRVASSLDSVVIGEQEIITQLRKAYEESRDAKLSGDALRIVMKQCVKTAKEIFTQTDLSRKPVSVVSLAWQELVKSGLKKDAQILLIGAGQVVRNFLKFLHEHGYTQFIIANRTKANAEKLATSFGGVAISLEELADYSGSFDALITCTAAIRPVVTKNLYVKLFKNNSTKKLIIDLGLPADVEKEIITAFNIQYIGMKQIQEQAAQNIHFRKQALNECEPIVAKAMKDFERMVQERHIELLMHSIPEAIKEIKSTALGEIFAKDLEQLDAASLEVLEKIMAYMEKKYISIPMKMAKEVLLDAVAKN